MITCFLLLTCHSTIEQLTSLLDSVPGFCIVGISTSATSGSVKLDQAKPDIVFISQELYVELHEKIKDCIHVQISDEILPVPAFGRIMSPNELEDRDNFMALIYNIAGKHFLNRQIPADDYFYLQTGVKARRNKVFFKEICFIESLSNYSKVHCKEESYMVYCSLKELVNALPAEVFRRIHKSYIININYISATEGNRIFLNNGKELTIGRLYKEAFCRLLDHHTLKFRVSNVKQN